MDICTQQILNKNKQKQTKTNNKQDNKPPIIRETDHPSQQGLDLAQVAEGTQHVLSV
jgi:hypothetical protein